MKTKIWLFILTLLLFSNTAYSFSPRMESLQLRNYSSKNVVVNIEFWEGTGNLNSDFVLYQTVFDIPLSITDMVRRNNIWQPNQSYSIIRYYPLGPQLFDRMVSLPFMDKMRAIFKNLEINFNNGERIITLENLDETIIKKIVSSGGVTYIIEIFDYDLEGRLASEW